MTDESRYEIEFLHEQVGEKDKRIAELELKCALPGNDWDSLSWREALRSQLIIELGKKNAELEQQLLEAERRGFGIGARAAMNENPHYQYNSMIGPDVDRLWNNYQQSRKEREVNSKAGTINHE